MSPQTYEKIQSFTVPRGGGDGDVLAPVAGTPARFVNVEAPTTGRAT